MERYHRFAENRRAIAQPAGSADYMVKDARFPDGGSGARENVEHAPARRRWVLAINVSPRHLEKVCVGVKSDVHQTVPLLGRQGHKIREQEQAVPQPATPKGDDE